MMIQSRWYRRLIVAAVSFSAMAVVVSLVTPRYRDMPADVASDDDALRSDVDQSVDLSHIAARIASPPPAALVVLLAVPLLVSAHVPLPEDRLRTAPTVWATAPRSPPFFG